ncbi:MAG: NAD-binding protein [Campylobacterota bacterium]|nr:NAD-binding protein [Campylobacterota bacterium]
MFSKLLVSSSYSLESSKNYAAAKSFTYDVLENDHSLKKRYFDFFMIFLVLSTVAILIYEVNHKLLPWLDNYETFAIIVFIIEWLGRLWISSSMHTQIINDYKQSQVLDKPFSLGASLKSIFKKKVEFIFSPMSIIDLLAILPYYRPLRILRIFLLFRLFKLLRYTNSINQFAHVFVDKRFEFFTLIVMFFMAIAFGSTIIFIYEGAGVNDNIHNFFDAVYWSIITISTVGYGDISPVTIEGRLATIFLVIGGLSVIAFFTSIVTTGLTERVEIIKKEKVFGEVTRYKELTIICGYGRMGKVLAEELQKIDEKFIIIDIDENMIEEAKSNNFLATASDATNVSLLEDLGVNLNVKSIVALTNNDAVNLSIVLAARSLNQTINIIARANYVQSKDKLTLAGANEVVLSNEVAALVSCEYIGQPVAFEAIDDILLDSEGAMMDEIEILDNSQYIGHLLTSIDFDTFNLSLIGIIDAKDRQNFIFNPKKDEYAISSSKEIMIVIGHIESIKEFKVHLLASKPKEIGS